MRSIFFFSISAFLFYLAYDITTSDKGGFFRNMWLDPWQGYFLYVAGAVFFLYEILEIKKEKSQKKKANHKIKRTG
jgi:hypothetical protein